MAEIVDDRLKLAAALYGTGKSMNAVGKALGVTGQTIERWLTSLEIEIRYRRPSYDDKIRAQAISLYQNENLSCVKVASRLGLKSHTIKEWVEAAGVIRSMSDAAVLSILAKPRGYKSVKKAIKNNITGKIVFADSSYEAARMIELKSDESVKFWDRCTDLIPYTDRLGRSHTYNPDLFIIWSDGRKTVEEIKPKSFLKKFNNPLKFAAAKIFYATTPIEYSFITEVNLDRKLLASFIAESMSDPDRRARAEFMRKALEARRNASETPEDRKIRLAHLAAYKRKIIANETPSQRAERLLKMSRRPNVTRENQTPEQRATRNKRRAQLAREDRRERNAMVTHFKIALKEPLP